MFMYSGDYAPWDHYPKTLRHYEVQNPFRVLVDFFSADTPKGHRKKLKQWRKFAIGDNYYCHERFGPASLLFTYKINLNLLEAMFLLLLENESAWPPKKVIGEQLAREKAAWRWYPKNLSEEELLEPFKAVRKIFKAFSLPQYRDHLDEWLEEALSLRTTAERMDPAEIIGIYDNLRRLYSAAWIIFQRNGMEPDLKDEETAQPINNHAPGKEAKRSGDNQLLTAVPQFNGQVTWAEGLGLEQVTSLIVKEMPTVKLIVHLHTCREPFTFYLLVLVKSSEALQEHEIANKIEEKCKPLANVFIFAHKLSGLKKALQAERRFFIDALTAGKVAYQAADFTMPSLPALSAGQIKAKAHLDFNRWNVQAQDFLRGARYYQELKNYNLAAFNLHQAVESIFIGTIKAVLGYKINVHNLSRMLRISLMFTDDLKDALQLDTGNGSELFEVLRSAYTNTRYISNYQVDERTVVALDALAVDLLRAGQKAYDDYMMRLGTTAAGKF